MDNFLWRLPPTLYLAIQQTFRSGNRLLSLFAILGIAVSVALATGMEMASRTLTDDLDRTAKALSGRAQLHVSAASGSMPESILDEVRSVPGVAAAVPITTTAVWLADGTPLHIVGIDFFSEHNIHGYSLSEGGVLIRDPLRLVSQPDSIVVTDVLANQLDLKLGDRIEAGSQDGPVSLVIRGILEPGGIADAYGGNIAAMDVYALQSVKGRAGFLERVDVTAARDVDLDQLATAIRHVVDGTAEVSATYGSGILSSLVATIQRGVLAIVVLAVFVAGLAAYIIMAMSIDRRLRELALHQLAGFEPRGVRTMILFEALVTGTLSVALGAPLAVLSSRGFLVFFSSVLSTVVGVAFEPAQFSASSLLVASGIGVGASLLAAVGPAKRASRLRPLDVIEAGNPRVEPLGRPMLPLAAGCAVVGAGSLVSGLPPYARLGLVCFGTLFVLAAVLRHGLYPGRRAMGPAIDRLLPQTGDLFGAALVARPARTAHTITGIAAIVAACLSIAATVESATRAVDTWFAAQFAGAVRIVASSPVSVGSRERLRPETIATISATEGIATTARFTGADARYRGDMIFIAGRDVREQASVAPLDLAGGASTDVLDRLLRGEVLITTVFARRYATKIGDVITLRTPRGERGFRVAGVVRDFSVVGGIIMTVERFASIWPGDQFDAIWIWPSGDEDELVRRVIERTADVQPLQIMHGDVMQRFGTRIFKRFSTLFLFISALAAGLGTLIAGNLVLGSVIERRNEIALLHVAGVRSRQLVFTVICDALATALIGAVGGIAISMLWAGPMLGILADAFGWEISYQLNGGHFGLAVALAATLAVVSGLYPSLRARSELATLAPFAD